MFWRCGGATLDIPTDYGDADQHWFEHWLFSLEVRSTPRICAAGPSALSTCSEVHYRNKKNRYNKQINH